MHLLAGIENVRCNGDVPECSPQRHTPAPQGNSHALQVVSHPDARLIGQEPTQLLEDLRLSRLLDDDVGGDARLQG